ncbi:MAG: OpgC domain-containing protein [Alphaproteobacteria bacterium]
MVRQPNAIDFWRGFALVSIYINHIPGIFFERFTHKNYAISDAADLFVFLAGWALGIVAIRLGTKGTRGDILSQFGGRIMKIYAAHILISTIAIAMLAIAAQYLNNPILLEWHNAAAFFYDPVHAHIGLVFLTHRLGYFNILPLYVVLTAMAPLIVLTYRAAPRALLPISLAIYLIVLTFKISLPTWPNEGWWFFNPFAWQLVFVTGFLIAQQEGLGAFVRKHIRIIKMIAIPIVIGGFFMLKFGWWPDPTKVPHPILLFIADKANATPIRFISFLALAAIFSGAYPYISAFTPKLVVILSTLGRNSLNVFCVGSLLSLFGQFVRFVFKGYLLVDIMILVCGVALLILTAWVSEWRKHKKQS